MKQEKDQSPRVDDNQDHLEHTEASEIHHSGKIEASMREDHPTGEFDTSKEGNRLDKVAEEGILTTPDDPGSLPEILQADFDQPAISLDPEHAEYVSTEAGSGPSKLKITLGLIGAGAALSVVFLLGKNSGDENNNTEAVGVTEQPETPETTPTTIREQPTTSTTEALETPETTPTTKIEQTASGVEAPEDGYYPNIDETTVEELKRINYPMDFIPTSLDLIDSDPTTFVYNVTSNTFAAFNTRDPERLVAAGWLKDAPSGNEATNAKSVVDGYFGPYAAIPPTLIELKDVTVRGDETTISFDYAHYNFESGSPILGFGDEGGYDYSKTGSVEGKVVVNTSTGRVISTPHPELN